MEVRDTKYSYSELAELFVYDPKTGFLRHKNDSAGQPVGRLGSNDYVNVTVRLRGKRVTLLAHRIAWLLSKGKWPAELIDHKNGIRFDNRLKNLREATYSQNSGHRRPFGETGIRGVYKRREKDGGSYFVQLVKEKKKYYGGTFYDIEAAQLAANKLIKKLYPNFHYL